MINNVRTYPGASTETNCSINVGTYPGASTSPSYPGASTSPYSSTSTEAPHERKSPRAGFHDYSGGDYFITICTQDKEHYFGTIKNGEMRFTDIGECARQKLKDLPTHYEYVEVPLFVVMPNHIHAIISIRETQDAPGCVPTQRTALSVVVGGYKQAVTMFARRNNIEFAWQSRYHDHIIRGTHDGNRIAEYIETNVARWDTDCFNS